MRPFLVGLAAFLALAIVLYALREAAAALFALLPPDRGGTAGEVLDVAWGVLTWVVVPFAAGFVALAGTFRLLRPGARGGAALEWYVRLVSFGALVYAILSVGLMGKPIYPDVVAVAVQALFAGLAGTLRAALAGVDPPEEV
jgi:hypothetical protein